MLSDVNFIMNIVLSLFLVFVSFSLVFFRNLTLNVVVMCIFSFLMALLYLIMDAPDVAITEASVGGGISTVLMLMALSLIGKNEGKVHFNIKIFPVIIALGMFISLMYVIPDLPVFGDPNSFAKNHVASYYLKNTYNNIGIPNVVTAILASFRGYDTLGETVVIFTASLGISLLLAKDNNHV
ncbi:DUF4040 domain-containing protein [Ehrlichia canis]|uniref:DUF4040 domain-containing protein n=1 Tax=Ehrlichia canis TaxID=944 RepID=UPI000C859D56|nr:DUF4040 domain-containing protein [Ehrlichia canis]AUO54671.1 cation:proton antiporter [Ehrlichia canis]UKC53637.1 DUF4040 domain-containing protein [Ehrlichia canis]UKC54575.1 DUF4040 domain-containing protein [Ehrlichia canis]UKC55511.1 DUF4040 domain-containing protein [Ehrlichia canis]